MTKPKNKLRIKSKTRRRQRKDSNNPINMNTKELYLRALDYENMNNDNICKAEPVPYSFNDTHNKSFYDLYSSAPPNVNNFLHCNTETDYKFFSSYGISDSITVLSEDEIKEPTTEMDVSINSNIIRGYLNNIKKRDYFYKL